MISLSELEVSFETKIGNKPKDIAQLFSFCKQENVGYKYSEIKRWWINNHDTNDQHQSMVIKENNMEPTKYKKMAKPRKSRNKLLYHRSTFINVLKQEIKCYKLILSKFNHRNNINASILKYKSFLNSLYSLKSMTKMPLSVDIQLLWRIHLIHPILYKQHCQTFCGLLLNPKYDQINFTKIPETNISEKHKKIKNSILIKRVFKSIDFKTQINLYLFFMKQIVEMVENDIINLNNNDIIDEYQQFFEIFPKSETFFNEHYDKIIRLIPTLKQSFLYYTHCLFPNTFHNEINIKTYSYQKYFNLNYIVIHIENQYKINSLWNTIKNINTDNKEKINVLNKMYKRIQCEYLVSGFINISSKSHIKLIVPMDILSVLSAFCGTYSPLTSKSIAISDQCSYHSTKTHFYVRDGAQIEYTDQRTLSMYGNMYGLDHYHGQWGGW